MARSMCAGSVRIEGGLLGSGLISQQRGQRQRAKANGRLVEQGAAGKQIREAINGLTTVGDNGFHAKPQSRKDAKKRGNPIDDAYLFGLTER